MRAQHGRIVAVSFVTFVAAGAALLRAEFTPPADGAYTEKQLTNYIAAMREWQDQLRAAGQAMQGAGGMASLGVMAKTNEKLKAVYAKHDMDESEFAWMGGQTWQAWTRVLTDGMSEQSDTDARKQIKAKDDDIAAQQKVIDAHRAAKAAGKRVLTGDEPARAIEQAKSDQQAALDEAKSHDDEAMQHADEAKQHRDAAAAAEKEAAQHDAEAKAADDAAKNPPADVPADDRQSYIDGKTNDANTARDAAKESRSQNEDALKAAQEADAAKSEAEKAAADSRAKAALAVKRVDDPTLIQSDDDKATAAKADDDAIAAARKQIDDDKAAKALLADSIGAFKKQVDASGDKEKTPDQNVALLKKHRTEWEQAFGMKMDDEKK